MRQRSCLPRLLMVFVLVALVLVQPTALLARAQEATAPPQLVTVVGVVGATLRTGPDGATVAVGIVPQGDVLTVVGPPQTTSGVVWWQVRTANGAIGFLPAGLLAAAPGDSGAYRAVATGEQPSAPAAGSQAVAATPTLAANLGTDPAGVTQNVQAGPSSQVVRQQPAPAPGAPIATPATTVPVSTFKPPRVAVEQRRGRSVGIAQLDEETAPNGRRMGAGRIVVGFKPGANQTTRLASHQAAGASAAVRAGLPEFAVVEVQPGTVRQALAAYRSRTDVAWAEPDYVRRVTLQPNDPMLPSQNGVNKIGAPIAWDVTTGSPSIKIAVLDCGVFSESSPYTPPDGGKGHEDLRGKIAPELEKNFTNATTGVDDWCNHGTLMAGIAGARTDAEKPTGVASVGFRSVLMNGKVLNDQGSGLDSWVAEGIVWAANNGADVISLSLGGSDPCSQTLQAAVNYAWEKGAVLVAAAGNGGDDQVGDPISDAPASCTRVVSVGAINQDDSRASFSNFGPPAAPRVQLAAPGVNVLSTNFVGGYSTVSGTSPSTPHVAGVAALVKARYGGTNQSIVDRILSMADPIAGTGTLWTNGRINAAAAVGPASCSPRPKVTVAASANGKALDVTVSTEGGGNALRYVQVGGTSGAPANATLKFPGTVGSSEVTGKVLYIPMTVGTTLTFQVTRANAGEPATVPFTVYDGCGAWQSFAGGGASAGF